MTIPGSWEVFGVAPEAGCHIVFRAPDHHAYQGASLRKLGFSRDQCTAIASAIRGIETDPAQVEEALHAWTKRRDGDRPSVFQSTRWAEIT